MSEILMQLVMMSNQLGNPQNDYVILGEGNSSARADEATFWVKASGTSLNGIDESGFVQVRLEPVLSLIDAPALSDTAVTDALQSATINASSQVRPSVETTFHAVALTTAEAQFVGHTHPTAVNSILCSQKAEEAFSGRLFPDEIVVCGPAPVFVPYTDPGIPLAKVIRDKIMVYQDGYGRSPKLILMQNHGMIALGQTADEVLRITAMAVKAARILLGAYTIGAPRFLTPADVARIDTRPDEHFRQRILAQRKI
ncbi:MAG: class II aldolase [Ardenticatenaceae bacterium]|nr:class II aldolase [Ardenticatenaceae bacterium]MCB9445615.1 class II aldolase [Ardenticatenaceae bacterium]